MRFRGERRIYFDSCYPPCGPGEFGGNRGIIASAAAEMKNLVIGSGTELIEEESPETRLPIIEVACLIERDQHIVIDVVRIGIRCRPILGHVHWAFDSPRARTDELLAWHPRKGSDDCARRHSGRKAQFLGIPA